MLREYRVPLMRGTLKVHEVSAVDMGRDWDGGMVCGLEYDAARGRVTLYCGTEPLAMTVAALHVEAELTAEVVRYLRRRALFLATLDTRWS